MKNCVEITALRSCTDRAFARAYMKGIGFGDDDLETMKRVREAFDPDCCMNPGKVFPSSRLCGEKPGPGGVEHPAVRSGEVQRW